MSSPLFGEITRDTQTNLKFEFRKENIVNISIPSPYQNKNNHNDGAKFEIYCPLSKKNEKDTLRITDVRTKSVWLLQLWETIMKDLTCSIVKMGDSQTQIKFTNIPKGSQCQLQTYFEMKNCDWFSFELCVDNIAMGILSFQIGNVVRDLENPNDIILTIICLSKEQSLFFAKKFANQCTLHFGLPVDHQDWKHIFYTVVTIAPKFLLSNEKVDELQKKLLSKILVSKLEYEVGQSDFTLDFEKTNGSFVVLQKSNSPNIHLYSQKFEFSIPDVLPNWEINDWSTVFLSLFNNFFSRALKFPETITKNKDSDWKIIVNDILECDLFDGNNSGFQFGVDYVLRKINAFLRENRFHSSVEKNTRNSTLGIIKDSELGNTIKFIRFGKNIQTFFELPEVIFMGQPITWNLDIFNFSLTILNPREEISGLTANNASPFQGIVINPIPNAKVYLSKLFVKSEIAHSHNHGFKSDIVNGHTKSLYPNSLFLPKQLFDINMFPKSILGKITSKNETKTTTHKMVYNKTRDIFEMTDVLKSIDYNGMFMLSIYDTRNVTNLCFPLGLYSNDQTD